MPFQVDLPGGWYDIPDSTWAANVYEDHLVALNSLIRFAAVADEYFSAAPQTDGSNVVLAASADDGYNYTRAESLYACSLQASPNHSTGKNSGQGNVLFFTDSVDQDTGLVHNDVNYYVQGGQESVTNDGLTAAIICCRRGSGRPVAVAGGTGGGAAGGGANQPTALSLGGNSGDTGDQGGQGTGDQKFPMTF